MIDDYKDIINRSRPIAKNRDPMPIKDRAAQFSPFAALTGHDAAIQERARETERKIELDAYMREALDHKLEVLLARKDEKPQVSICYFQEDKRKKGGTYLKKAGSIIRINEHKGKIYMDDRTEISIEDILDIEGKIFNVFFDE